MNDKRPKNPIKVTHPKYGTGEVYEYFEFYNEEFMNIKFEKLDKVIYLSSDSIKKI